MINRTINVGSHLLWIVAVVTILLCWSVVNQTMAGPSLPIQTAFSVTPTLLFGQIVAPPGSAIAVADKTSTAAIWMAALGILSAVVNGIINVIMKRINSKELASTQQFNLDKRAAEHDCDQKISQVRQEVRSEYQAILGVVIRAHNQGEPITQQMIAAVDPATLAAIISIPMGSGPLSNSLPPASIPVSSVNPAH